MNHACLLCGSPTSRIRHRKIADFYFCNHCEFISKDEQHIVTAEEELALYEKHTNSIDDPRYVAFFYEFLNDSVFPYVSVGKNGLDFGSGPSPVLAQILESKHHYQMDIYDLYYAPEKVYTEKKYDLITSTEVIEHLKNPIEYFELFAELLNPQGILAVMTLFHPMNPDIFVNWHYMRDRSHISFYTPKTMGFLATKVGLKVIHTNNIRYTTFSLA